MTTYDDHRYLTASLQQLDVMLRMTYARYIHAEFNLELFYGKLRITHLGFHLKWDTDTVVTDGKSRSVFVYFKDQLEGDEDGSGDILSVDNSLMPDGQVLALKDWLASYVLWLYSADNCERIRRIYLERLREETNPKRKDKPVFYRIEYGYVSGIIAVGDDWSGLTLDVPGSAGHRIFLHYPVD